VTLSNSYGANEVLTVDLGLTDIDTSSSDYGSLLAALTAAASANPDVSFDGVSTLTYTAPSDGASMADLIVDLPLTDDGFVEGSEDFSLDLTNPTSSSGLTVTVDANAASTTTTIQDTQGPGGVLDGPSDWSITGPANGDEGTAPQYTVALGGTYGSGEVITVDFGLTDIDTNSGDYANLVTAITAAVATNPDVVFDASTGTLIYTAPNDNAAMTDIVIDLALLDDALIEGPEEFSLDLSNPASSSGAVVGVDAMAASVTTSIGDTQGPNGADDGPAEWSITGDMSADEADLASYTVTLTGSYGAGDQVSVVLNLSDVDTNNLDYADLDSAIAAATAGRNDISYDSATNTLTFTSAADGSSMTPFIFEVAVVDDAFVEGPEDYQIVLSTPSSATGITSSLSASDTATTTIQDTQAAGGPADGPAEWSVTGAAEVNEGDAAVYNVALGGLYQAGEVITVELALTDNTTTPADYNAWITAVQAAVAANADVTFDAATGALSYTAPADGASMTPLAINLATVADGLIEQREDFTVSLVNPISTTDATASISATANSVTTVINGPPVPEDDINVTTIDTLVSGTVLPNDSDPDGEALTVSEVNGSPISSPILTANGVVVMAADGSYTYTPNAGFVGTDTFDYEVCDASGNCVIASVSIAVSDPANPSNTAPFALDDSFTTFSDPASPATLTGAVLGNDSDPDGDVLAVSMAGGVAPGTSFTTTNGGTVVVNANS